MSERTQSRSPLEIAQDWVRTITPTLGPDEEATVEIAGLFEATRRWDSLVVEEAIPELRDVRRWSGVADTLWITRGESPEHGMMTGTLAGAINRALDQMQMEDHVKYFGTSDVPVRGGVKNSDGSWGPDLRQAGSARRHTFVLEVCYTQTLDEGREKGQTFYFPTRTVKRVLLVDIQPKPQHARSPIQIIFEQWQVPQSGHAPAMDQRNEFAPLVWTESGPANARDLCLPLSAFFVSDHQPPTLDKLPIELRNRTTWANTLVRVPAARLNQICEDVARELIPLIPVFRHQRFSPALATVLPRLSADVNAVAIAVAARPGSSVGAGFATKGWDIDVVLGAIPELAEARWEGFVNVLVVPIEYEPHGMMSACLNNAISTAIGVQGCSDLLLPTDTRGPGGFRSPDGSWRPILAQSRGPTLVIEVSYSQPLHKARRKVMEHYFTASTVQRVIIVDISPKSPHPPRQVALSPVRIHIEQWHRVNNTPTLDLSPAHAPLDWIEGDEPPTRPLLLPLACLFVTRPLAENRPLLLRTEAAWDSAMAEVPVAELDRIFRNILGGSSLPSVLIGLAQKSTPAFRPVFSD
ncbi:hypothetical protein MNV49_001296 [Pseudohyphozyma bogoriensis]|nr:hypothetical protein MNV49_001296 [Pseudohyphozyma bogoriensis]